MFSSFKYTQLLYCAFAHLLFCAVTQLLVPPPLDTGLRWNDNFSVLALEDAIAV
jgi:hypothetical protein